MDSMGRKDCGTSTTDEVDAGVKDLFDALEPVLIVSRAWSLAALSFHMYLTSFSLSGKLSHIGRWNLEMEDRRTDPVSIFVKIEIAMSCNGG